MESDAKLGLLAGVTAVVMVAVVYFNKPPATLAGTRPASVVTASVDRPPADPPAAPPASVGMPTWYVRPTDPPRDD